MIGSTFNYLDKEQRKEFAARACELLSAHGMKLDKHSEMFGILEDAGCKVNRETGLVVFPADVLEKLLALAPKSFVLGARNPEKALELPRPDGTFYARTCTGGHGWLDPETGQCGKVTLGRLADWAKLVGFLDEISFMPFLFADDAPVKTADIHALATILKNMDKHAWVQPYTFESVEHLIKLGQAASGGAEAMFKNPAISVIACSLTPRAFKMMDIEIILQSAKAGAPIQACSLPGAGGTSPATMAGTALLAVAELMAMVAMAQAVRPGAPVVTCPIIFSTDMRTGRSMQASVEAMRGASLAVQVLKSEFGLPTHCYGSGADSPTADEQSMSERALLSAWQAASGLDILGGAGQLEVATVVSPLQLLIDNEVLGMARRLKAPVEMNDDQMAWDVITGTEPGQHFMTSPHTFKHCRDGLEPMNFVRSTRGVWEKEGCLSLLDRVKADYGKLMAKENGAMAGAELCDELDGLVRAADQAMGK